MTDNNFKENISNFRNEIENFSIEELETKRGELQNAISKMILDSDMILKIAIIESRMKELRGE